MIGYDGINATSHIDWNQVIFSDQATRRLNPRLAFARKEKSSSDSEESDKSECVGGAFRAVGFIVFTASKEISTLTCSAKLISAISCQLLQTKIK